jgi:autotransporter-associated beta strand protein
MLLGKATAQVVAPPGLPPGSEYQLIFATTNGTTATSSDINFYNSFVTQQAAESPTLPPATWSAVVSTATVDANVNAQTYSNVPIYNTQGQLVASGYAQLWSGNPANFVSYDQFGNAYHYGLWTGTQPNGMKAPSNYLGAAWAVYSGIGVGGGGWMDDGTSPPGNQTMSLYALSSPILAVPEPAWTAATGGNWSNAGNWTKAVPNAIGAGAVINAPTKSALAIALNAPVTVGTLLFSNSAAAGVGYTLNGTGSNALTLNNSGSGATITVVQGAYSVAAPVVLNDNLTVSNNLTPSSTASLAVGGAIANGVNGPKGLTLSGGGLLTLSAANTYSGNTMINNGTMLLAHPLAVQNSTVGVGWSGALDFAAGVTSPVVGGLLGTGNVVLTTAAAEPVTLNVGGNGQSTTYNGVLSGAGGLAKQGSGTMTLTAPSTYNGPTVIAGGVVNFLGAPKASGATISAGGTASPGSYNLTGGLLSITAAGNDFWGAVQQGYYVYTPVPSNKNFDVAVHVAGMTIANIDGWEKAGIMVRQDASNNNVPTLLLAQTTGNGISLERVDQSQIYPSSGTSLGPNWLQMTYNAASGTFTAYESPSASLTVPAANDPSWAYVGYFTMSMGTANTFLLGIADTAHNNAHTVTAVFDNLGNLFPLNAPVNCLPTGTALSIASGGTLDLSGGSQQVASLTDKTPGSGGSVINSNSAASVLTLSPSGGSTTFSGMIRGGGALGTIGLVLSGSGMQVLSGSNTYTGPTTINQGELLVDGSLFSPVTVNSGGTLGGSGTLNRLVNIVGGRLAPGGLSSGDLIIAGPLNFQGGELDIDGVGSSITDLSITGNLSLNGAPTLDVRGSLAAGTYTIASYGGTLSGQFSALNIPAGDTINYGTGSNSSITLSAVPEPSTAALLGAGVLGLIGWAWRRRLRNVKAPSRALFLGIAAPACFFELERARRPDV